MSKNHLAGVPLVIFASAFWSTSGIFITRILNESSLTSINLAFWRELSTFLVLFVSIALLRPSLLRVMKRDLPWLIGMGSISIGLFHVLWNTSVMTNGMAIATVIQCNAPVFVAIVARLLWKEPFNRFKIGAIFLSILGTVLIARVEGFGGMNITLIGLSVALASSLAYGSVSIFGKKLAGDYSPWTILTYAFGFGTLTLLPFQTQSSASDLFPIAIPFAGLVLLTSIGGYVLYFASLQRLPASVASILSTSEVPFAAFLAYLVMKETMSGWQIIGAILIVSGVALVSLSNGSPEKPEPMPSDKVVKAS